MSATVLYMSMSLDGFIAGPNERPDNGLGDGGHRLHEWALTGADADADADRKRADRLPELAKGRRLGVRDPVARRHEPLLPQPRLRLLRGPDAVPVGREVVVVGVDEALEELEAPRSLRPPSGLDLLADPSLVVLVHASRPA